MAADTVARDQASLTLRGTVYQRVAVSLETPRSGETFYGSNTPGFATVARVATATNMRTRCDVTIECIDNEVVPIMLNGSPANYSDGSVRVAAFGTDGSSAPVMVSAVEGSTGTLVLEIAAR
jgi:hypothetical protein